MAMVDDAIAKMRDFIDQMGEPLTRGPILNRLAREQMDGYKWHLIFERDSGFCYICGMPVEKGTGEVDHVRPRSSFPPEEILVADRSDNLRTTHVACNQSKSNYIYEESPRTNGVVASCWECYFDRGFDQDIDPESFAEHRREFPRPIMTVTAYCAKCGVTWVPDEGWLM